MTWCVRTIALTVAISSSGVFADPVLVDRVAIVVAKDPILLSDVDAAVPAAQRAALDALAADEQSQQLLALRQSAATTLVNEALIRQTIQEKGLTVPEDELDKQINYIAETNHVPLEQMQAAIAREGLDWEQYRAELKAQMERQRFQTAEIASRVTINDAEVRQEYDAQKARSAGAKLMRFERLRVPAMRADGTQPLTDVQQALAQGSPFAEVAKQYSDLPGAQAGSVEVGPLNPDQLNETFRTTLAALTPGQVSEPIVVGSSVWLLHLVSVEAAGFPSFEEKKDEITERLWQAEVNRQTERWLTKRRLEVSIDYRMPELVSDTTEASQ